MEQLTGRSLGDFVVRHRIGEGGFGDVYRAEQPVLGREAVIKVLRAHHRGSKTLIQRFLREARLASRLDHPYAAHIYAFGVEHDGLMWIAMDLVKGQTLHERLREKGPISLEEFVPLLDRICEVLQAAHDLGIVHRDIKPPNVMVVQRSGRAFPKLLDFGIAKVNVAETTPIPITIERALEVAQVAASADARAATAQLVSPLGGTVPAPVQAVGPTPAVTDGTVSFVGVPGGALARLNQVADRASDTPNGTAPTATPAATPTDEEPVLTEAGAAIGSPPYMAPEQWYDSSLATGRTDLYSLGVLAYEAITGRRPFGGATITAIALEHATKAVPPLGPGFPPALDAVLAKVLAKEPVGRYATAMEFASEFRAAAGFGDQPLPAFDDELRASIESSFPQPIAEAVAAYHAARNPHHGRDALRAIVSTSIRFITLTALAAHAQVRLGDGVTVPTLGRSLQELRRRPLSDEEWLELARDLVRPFAAQRQAHPVPEIVALLASDSEADALSVAVRPRAAHPDALQDVRAALAEVTRLLRAITFLADYQLVVIQGGRAESWMGLRRPLRIGVELHGRAVEAGHPVLVDRANRPVLSFWPLIQASSPMLGAPPELFLLDGRGRRGARLLALPQPLERQDERVWEWLGERFAERDGDAALSSSSDEVAPFRGLASFTSDDAGRFVGREREIDSAVNRLQTAPFVAVVGPSGAGKSSFVHAGLLPSLPEGWTAIALRPGNAPLAAVEARLRRAGFAVDGLVEAIATDPAALGERLRAGNPDRTIVLVIDQFEELLTLGASLEQQRLFVRALLAAAPSVDDRVRIVITLRDDFLAAATHLPELRERLPSALYLLGTPERSELLRILTEPLRRLGFDFEDTSLPAQMVDAVENTPGALALLSFAAQKLWELRDRHFRQLTRRAYEALGGVAGALAQHAEATLAAISASEQRLARIAFGHLVTAEGTRAILSRVELQQLLDDPNGDAVIEKLIAARLLVATESESGEDRIELVHEALLVAWPRLGNWRREDAEGARLRDQVRAAARQWVERGSPRGLLWRDEALAELQVWRARHPQRMTESDEAFINASLSEAARGRRWRRGVIAGVLGLMACAVAVLIWSNRQTEAERRVAETERSHAQQLASTAERTLTAQYLQRGREAMLVGDAPLALAYLNEAFQRGADGPGLRFLLAAATAPLRGELRVLHHRDKVYSAEWSPDGTRLLSASGDGTARIWDAASGRELATLDANAIVFCAHYDRSGRWIATCAADGSVRIYDAGGTRGHQLDASSGMVQELAFSPDGRSLAIVAQAGASLWNVETGKLVARLDAGRATQLPVFSPDGKRLVVVGIGVSMFDAATGARIASLEGHTDSLQSASFSSDGRYLVTASVDQTARLWDAGSGAPLAVLRGSTGIVNAAAFAPDGKLVVTGSKDGIGRAYHVPGGELAFTLQGHTTGIRAVAFDVTGKLVATAGADGRAIVWDTSTGAALGSLQGHMGTVRSVEFSPDGHELVTASYDGTVRIWRPVLTPLRHLLAHAKDLSDARFSPDGTSIVTAGDDGTVRIWSTATGELVRELTGHHDALTVVRFGSDGHKLVTGDQAGSLIVWDLEAGRSLSRWSDPDHVGVTGLAIAQDGTIAFGDQHGAVRAWRGSAEPQVLQRGGGKQVAAVAFSHDGSRLVAGGWDGWVRSWRARDGSSLGELDVKGRVWEISFAPDDGRYVVAHDGAAVVVSTDGMRIEHVLRHRGFVESARFRGDGNQIVTASEDGTAALWNAQTGANEAVLRGHGNVVFTADYDRTGQFVITAGDDRSARLWDSSNGQLLANLQAHSIGLQAAQFDPSGRFAATLGMDHLAVIWGIELEDRDRASVAAFVRCHVPWKVVDASVQAHDLECK